MQRFIILAALAAVASAQFCARPGELVPNPTNCQEFFMCRTGRTILFTCPANTLFNPRTLACDTTNRVRCEFGTLPNNVLASAIRAEPSRIDHTVTACINRPIATLLPNTADCSRFYQCSITGAIGFQCPAGTLFDVRRNFCEDRTLATCGTVGNPNLPLVPPVVVPPMLPPSLPAWPALPPSLPTWPALPPSLPTWPAQPPSLPAWPALPPSLPVVPPSNDNNLQMLCRGKPIGTKVRNPVNCRQFVNCVGSTMLRFVSCPTGTAFDNVRMTCDWIQNVNC